VSLRPRRRHDRPAAASRRVQWRPFPAAVAALLRLLLVTPAATGQAAPGQAAGASTALAGQATMAAAAGAGQAAPAPAAEAGQATTAAAGGQAPGASAVAVADAEGPAPRSSQPPTTTALLADFDGDHRTDLFWYGPGAKDDHLWLGRPDRNFVGVPHSVGGLYLPLVGDFNGDHRDDVLWYGPGSGRDVIWFGRAGGRFAGRTVTVRGDYEPLVGDFNGDGRRDVLWYGPGAAADVVWYGGAGGRFRGRSLKVAGSYQPLLADFNGDGRRDVFWYGPGAGNDVVWYGRTRGGFAARSVRVNGAYQPVVGDFDGNGSRDVLWYGPGAGNDVLWSGHRNASFSGRKLAVGGTYQPVTGDFDGDGRRDVLWYGPGAGNDVLWYGRPGGFSGKATAVRGSYQPLVGDYGGDGPDDVLWWATGPPNDVLWFGRAGRRFTSRSTTVDLGYARALALRADTFAGHYDPYGFVAHAFGAIDGRPYTNSLEAFQRNYRRGFRVFEVDQVLLADGTVLLAHDGLEANYGLRKPFQRATWRDLAGHRYLGRYTVLRSQDMLRLLVDHPDAYLIPDPKYSRPQIFRTYVRQAAAMGRLDLLERVMPHVEDQAELNELRRFYPLQNYVLALYHTQAQNRYDDPQAIDFVRRNRAPAVMMWWRERSSSISLAANGRQSRRYRPALARGLRAAGATLYVHSLADPAQIRRFWDRGIGVYSDEPFPPFGGTAPVLRTPEFDDGTAEEAAPPA
jgi:glycerophosphoryl diester phosphodiesterase